MPRPDPNVPPVPVTPTPVTPPVAGGVSAVSLGSDALKSVTIELGASGVFLIGASITQFLGEPINHRLQFQVLSRDAAGNPDVVFVQTNIKTILTNI